MIDDGVGGHRAALMILQLERGDPFQKCQESSRVERECDAMEAGGFPRALRLAGEQREFREYTSLEIVGGPLGFF